MIPVARAELLANLRRYLRASRATGPEITEYTRLDALNLDQLDSVAISDILASSYGVDPMRWYRYGSECHTVGDLITSIESFVRALDESDGTFCDSENIVFICYPGGAGGFALRYIMLLSPELEMTDIDPDGWITDDGAAHYMISRFGLKWYREDGSLEKRYETIHAMSGMVGQENSLLSFFMPFVQPGLIRSCRSIFNGACTWDDMPVSGQAGSRLHIMADHVPPSAARAIFPRARLLALRMPVHQCMRNFWNKNLLAPEEPHEVQSRLSKILEQRGLGLDGDSVDGMLVAQLNHSKLLDRMFEPPLLTEDTYIVDANAMFSADGWMPEYDRLMAHCGLTPNYDAVAKFVDDYASRQFDRFSAHR